MVTKLPVKRGISAPALNSIPEQWSKEWFRAFITQFLVDIDTRNATTSGLTISGNISGNNSSNPGNTVTAGINPVSTFIIGAGVGIFTLTGQVQVLKANTGGSGNFTLVAGSGAGPPQATYGFDNGVFGSISPTTLSGYTILQLQSLIDTTINNQYQDTFQLSAPTDPGRNLFTSITVGLKTRTSASASYLFSGGIAQWIWMAGGASSGLFTSTGSNTVTIT